MRVLLDTSYLYDLLEAPRMLSAAERLFLSRQDSQPYVSAVSIWEMRLKYRARHVSGDRKSPFDPLEVMAVLEGQNVIFLPMTASHAACSLKTPIDHRDPFDEMLLVQAQEENLKLLTVDRRLVEHPLAIEV
ncbi:MAG: type II toxin-antitoxin system VapC family toxin [Gammaproteobacteria bacterium]|nr:type II toxin-antitoxin system VapC family toxin [Gammaproteobacteria bacterium]